MPPASLPNTATFRPSSRSRAANASASNSLGAARFRRHLSLAPQPVVQPPVEPMRQPLVCPLASAMPRRYRQPKAGIRSSRHRQGAVDLRLAPRTITYRRDVPTSHEHPEPSQRPQVDGHRDEQERHQPRPVEAVDERQQRSYAPPPSPPTTAPRPTPMTPVNRTDAIKPSPARTRAMGIAVDRRPPPPCRLLGGGG